MTLDPDIEAKVRASFARQSMMSTLGAVMTDIKEGRVTITAPITLATLQQQGAAHAALAFAIGDSAAGYAALTQVAPELEVMTVEMKINLLRPAIGTGLIAEGYVIKPGRRISVVAASVYALSDTEDRREIARLQGTMIPVEA